MTLARTWLEWPSGRHPLAHPWPDSPSGRHDPRADLAGMAKRAPSSSLEWPSGRRASLMPLAGRGRCGVARLRWRGRRWRVTDGPRIRLGPGMTDGAGAMAFSRAGHGQRRRMPLLRPRPGIASVARLGSPGREAAGGVRGRGGLGGAWGGLGCGHPSAFSEFACRTLSLTCSPA